MSTIATLVNTTKMWQSVYLIIALVEAVALLAIWNKYHDLKKQVPYSWHEQIYVERAIQAYAQKHRLPKEVVMKGRFPVVAKTREGVCVNIIGYAGRIGHVPIYCFERNGHLVFHEER